MKTAIILGATGLTGSFLLQKLIEDSRYGKIILFSRSSAAVKDPKVEEHLIDLFHLKDHKDKFKADDVFVCIGTTKSKTPDEETYRKIDYGIPVDAAQLCRENNIQTYAVISALGADANSSIFYNRIKGEMEQDVLAQKIPQTYIFQPSLIAGEREEKRVGEDLAKKVMSVVDYALVGPLKKYRSIHPENIAKAMVYAANHPYSGKRITSRQIREIAMGVK